MKFLKQTIDQRKVSPIHSVSTQSRSPFAQSDYEMHLTPLVVYYGGWQSSKLMSTTEKALSLDISGTGVTELAAQTDFY